MSETPIVQVKFTDKFKRNLRKLAKKYRSIRQDIQPIIAQLEAGKLPGNRIIGIALTRLGILSGDLLK